MKKNILFLREIYTLNDGGEVALDWLEPIRRPNDMDDATILFLPGLTGDSKCEYVRATSLAVQKSGFRIVVFNYRGIGGIKLKVILKMAKHLLLSILPYNTIECVFPMLFYYYKYICRPFGEKKEKHTRNFSN